MLQSTLDTFSVSDILALLCQLKKSGVLVVVGRERERGFVFKDGNLVYATSHESAKRLGSYLVDLGFAAREDLERVFNAGFGREGYVGRRIVQAGLVSSKDLAKAIKAQIADIVAEVIEWDEGAIHFDEVELPFPVDASELISTHSVLFDCSRLLDERRQAREIFPDESLVFAPIEEPALDMLGPLEVEVFQHVDGERSIADILSETGGSLLASAKALENLVRIGFIAPDERENEGDAAHARSLPEMRIVPIAPDIASSLLNVFRTANSDGELRDRIKSIVERDPMLTAKLLKLLSLSNVVICRADVDIGRMLDILGLFHVRCGLLPEAARGFFYPPQDWYRNDFWSHSHVCAILTRKLSLACGYPHPEEAYIAGLLHNIGAFLLSYHSPAEYAALIARSTYDRIDVEKLEIDQFGVGHSSLGASFAERWSFPMVVTTSIKMHHRNYAPRAPTALADCVTVALGALSAFGFRIGFHEGIGEAAQSAARRLGLERRVIEDLARDARRDAGLSTAARSGRSFTTERPKSTGPRRVLGR